LLGIDKNIGGIRYAGGIVMVDNDCFHPERARELELHAVLRAKIDRYQ
jgi:hypothetical protein